MRVFFITGAAIGVIGTWPGFSWHADLPERRIDPAVPVLADQHRAVFAGILFSVAASGRDGLGETTAVVIMALTLSLLATLYPSFRAARLDPVEALRYE